MNTCAVFIFALLLTLLPAALLRAEIYSYTDAAGMVHFSNVPHSAHYWQRIRAKINSQKKVSGSGSANSVDHYDPLIRKASKQNAVAFALVKAVIKAESNFKADAVSPAGAMGIMQIMPINLKPLNINDPFNPAENIMGGSLYLKQLLIQFEGNLPLVLAAYNAGPKAVERNGSVPPYAETQRYVKQVMAYYQEYQREDPLAKKEN